MAYRYFIFILSLIFSGTTLVSVQAQSKGNTSDFDNNRTIIINENDIVDETIEQKGSSNTIFIIADNNTSNKAVFSGIQKGIYNRLFALTGKNTVPLATDIEQTGEKNTIFIIQGLHKKSSNIDSESTSDGENSVKIKQNGNNNRATVIQNES